MRFFKITKTQNKLQALVYVIVFGKKGGGRQTLTQMSIDIDAWCLLLDNAMASDKSPLTIKHHMTLNHSLNFFCSLTSKLNYLNEQSFPIDQTDDELFNNKHYCVVGLRALMKRDC